ncbi:phosphotransferase enzyme family protein [Shewanella inventionis]|uniref:Aminoglycoside phosphotransferase n=1 Tax=Shewanella inventionis TaxID=1738770 RepID=A0ABQ1IK39_9GAMM|nr:aminoglycoside phosphotransferase family protein [Shewanella inventionis]MCL1156305.1 aminoglycoside phosphotransferase family protein [Shewanella inventionis]GGB44494.1 aminoglycoside phosphotransferase [Shewanella inventionis]
MIAFIRQVVVPQFGFYSADTTITPLGNGHINHTFLVANPTKKVVLQKLNTAIFTMPDAVVNNSANISHHLLSKRKEKHYAMQVISPVLTESGLLGLDLGEQGFWRAIDYLEYSHTIDVVTIAQQAEVAAYAFGHFASALSDMHTDSVVDVIPNFLNLPQRLAQLRQSVDSDLCGRLATCQPWAEYALSQTEVLAQLADFETKLPKRICHNDTKINNMLFDKRDMSSMAIIDLDTCMSGYLMYDFGDMVRAFCSPEPEDSTLLNHVYARPEIITIATKAYLEALNGIITPLEKQSLWLGIKVMSLMLGARFLTDYLTGDVYFATEHSQHNLDRAINQLTIYQSLVKQQAQLITLFN